MNNSPLLNILGSLDRKEISLLHKWVNSPMHNHREDVSQLYDYLTNSVTGFREDCLDKKLIWNTLFPSKLYNENLMRQLIHKLLIIVENFLSYQTFQTVPLQKESYLLKALRERNLDRLFQKRLKATQKQATVSQKKNYYSLQQQYQLRLEEFTFAENQKRTVPIDIQILSDTLDQSYCIEKLRSACVFLSRKTLVKSSLNIRMIDNVIKMIQTAEWLNNPAISTYYYCYLALYGPPKTSEEHFQKLLECLQSNEANFPKRELRSLYLLAINYVIRRINSDTLNYLDTAFFLYKEGIEKGYLVTGKTLSLWTYNNTVICGTRLKQFEWVENFIYQYKSYLTPEHQESTFQECLARFYFEKKDYNKAMELFNQVEFKDSLQNLNTRILLAIMYFEEEEFDALETLLNSMKAFIRRKRVMGYHKANYMNFAKMLVKLLYCPAFDKQALKVLQTEIIETKPLPRRQWLLEQLDKKH